MPITVLDKRLEELVDRDVAVERIGTGFVFTEGPVWHPGERQLRFSDVRNDTMWRWTEKDGAVVYRQPSGGSNGNTLDRQGRLVTCEHHTRRMSRTNADGSVETLVDSFEGKRLNSPNDVICAPNGDIIFTDPPFGLRQPDGSFAGQELPYAGVFRVSAADGSVRLLTDELQMPNGLVLSDDGSRLLVDDTYQHEVRSFDVAADGTLSKNRRFVLAVRGDTRGGVDGMKLDSRGNLYIAANTADGLWVYSPDGTLLGFIDVGEAPANLAWGGDDWQTLFVTARTSVYRLRMRVAGQPLVVSNK